MAHFTVDALDDAIRWGDAAGIRVAVETGTFEAQTTRLLCARFLTVHTIELEPQRWRRCVETMQALGAVFHLGDSAAVLPLLSAAYSDQPVLWYLDAHWFAPSIGRGKWDLPVADVSPFPLWAELEAIAARSQPDLVIVDDVHAFGREELEWSAVSSHLIDGRLWDRLDRSAIAGDQYLARLKNAC